MNKFPLLTEIYITCNVETFKKEEQADDLKRWIDIVSKRDIDDARCVLQKSTAQTKKLIVVRYMIRDFDQGDSWSHPFKLGHVSRIEV